MVNKKMELANAGWIMLFLGTSGLAIVIGKAIYEYEGATNFAMYICGVLVLCGMFVLSMCGKY